MTTTNKQRRLRYMQRVKERRSAEEPIQLADHPPRAPEPPAEPAAEPYFAPGDTFTFAPEQPAAATPQPESRRRPGPSRNHLLRSMLAVSLLALPTRE